jgi:hypothetical protein
MIETLSIEQARRLALAAQGFDATRPSGRVDRRHLRAVLDSVGVIQIDSVNVVARSQELVLFSRLGAHPRHLIPRAADDGEVFEYWVHEASHVPSAHHPLHRWKMERGPGWRSVAELQARRPALIEDIYARVRDQGPVLAAQVSEREGPKGPWWDWDDAKRALEYLFWCGRLVATRRDRDFARRYDLPERVLPAEILALPTPSESDARRELLILAAGHLGVATLADLADYHRQQLSTCRVLVAELVEAGRLVTVAVEGWTEQAYCLPGAKVPAAVQARALLSPFDPVVWNRPRAERLFGFRYRIEIYTPAAKRTFGYYVLPVLVGDTLVGRLDVKADRARSVLSVPGAFAEAWVDTSRDRARVAREMAAELSLMAEWLELDRVEVGRRGDLAEALGRCRGISVAA